MPMGLPPTRWSGRWRALTRRVIPASGSSSPRGGSTCGNSDG